MSVPDPRTTLVRDGVAARALEGIVPARRYVEPRAAVCAADEAPIRQEPEPTARQADQLLHGEPFHVLEEQGGFAFGQAGRDGYVGWVEAAALAPSGPAPTHRVAAPRTWRFTGPDLKAAPCGLLSLNALVLAGEAEGRFVRAGDGWLFTGHLRPVGQRFETDAAGVARRFEGAPYRWGGRDSLGLDCSGLVQQAFYACGRACPRDSDQQLDLGTSVVGDDLARGDLAYWRGHVGVMLDCERLLHANAHHMAVAVEPLEEACARIAAAGGGEASFRRP